MYCKISLEGIVVQRAECRPAVSENYMKLKKLQIEVSTKPQHLTEQIDRAVTNNFKPVSNHVANVEYEKKKAEGRMVRADRQQVMDMLFSAFEKHQHYNIKDLVEVAKQPVFVDEDNVHSTDRAGLAAVILHLCRRIRPQQTAINVLRSTDHLRGGEEKYQRKIGRGWEESEC
ncbi:unnamed protein product [Coregonus sp. 'balchen']|nr:unnamed protein product [Coregonus sp. 'balchen']